MDLIMHWNVWIHGSDVTNVIFYSLYLSVVLPCQCVFDLVGFTCHEISEDRLARPFWKYLNIFSYFVPVDGNLCYGSSGTNSLGELWLVMSNTLQMFQSHFEKTKNKKKTTLLDLGWLLVHMRLYSFVALLAVFSSAICLFSLYNCQHFVSLPSWIGEIFHSLCAA